jgi:seryl-tRNA synthetase
MIDLKALRENPARFALGAKAKGVSVDIERLLQLDEQKRQITMEREKLRSEQNRLSKDAGPQIGKLQGQLKGAHGEAREQIEKQLEELKLAPARMKAAIQELEAKEQQLEPAIRDLLLQVPLPPDGDVPVGQGSEGNVEVKRWNPPPSAALPHGFDTSKSFEQNKGFAAKGHIELLANLGLADFERGVKLAGSRSYVLRGAGMRLHQAVLQYAFNYMVDKHGFTPMSVPTIVREETMVGTGFFPAGREQAYHVEETKRGGGYDLFLTGTGEVGLMGVHSDEILDEAQLPLKYVTVST